MLLISQQYILIYIANYTLSVLASCPQSFDCEANAPAKPELDT